ncbi:MAG: hypothetical protein HY079_03065 [Elusimicrobia bacterium]|nr:hypothetical protein [Elusimicrobiota bacterium]
MSRRTPLLAACLLALWPRAVCAAVARSAPLYSAPGEAWSGAVGGALSGGAGAAALAPALAPLAAPGLSPAGYAPVVAQLQGALALTPQAFAALPLHERRSALELALEEAQSDLRVKAFALVERANAIAAPDKSLDKEGRAELYRVVAQLQELERDYGPLVPEDSRGLVADARGRAAARAVEVRDELLGRRAKALAAALAGAGRDEPSAAAAARAALPRPSNGAVHLAAEMRNHVKGWKLRDLDSLLVGYGFVLKEGSNHRKYEFPGMKPQIVPRHKDAEISAAYIADALEAIDEIERRRAGTPADAPAPPPLAATDGPGRWVDLTSLSVLLGEESKSKPKARPETEAAPRPVEARPQKPKKAALAPATPRPAPAPKAEPPAPAPKTPPAAPPTAAPAEPEPSRPTLGDKLRGLWQNLRGPR